MTVIHEFENACNRKQDKERNQKDVAYQRMISGRTSLNRIGFRIA